MTTNEIIQVFKARKFGKGWRARCPGHGSKHGTLSLARGRANNTVLHCFAGCTTKDIMDAVGLKVRDLYESEFISPQVAGRLERENKLARLKKASGYYTMLRVTEPDMSYHWGLMAAAADELITQLEAKR